VTEPTTDDTRPPCVCDFPPGACRDTHCRCYHHGYGTRPRFADAMDAAPEFRAWKQRIRAAEHARIRAAVVALREYETNGPRHVRERAWNRCVDRVLSILDREEQG
jgi:hypothetical protein